VILSRNVAEETSMLVIRQLNELGAEVRFVPLPNDMFGDAPLPEPIKPAEQAEGARVKLPFFTLPSKLAVKLPSLRFRTGPLTDYSSKQIGKNLLIIAAMLAIAWTLNHVIAPQSLLLGVYTLPTVVVAYFFGRSWSLLTACASILLAGLLCLLAPENANPFHLAGIGGDSPWFHLLAWGCILLATAFAMGTLYERNKSKAQELRITYQGLLQILSHATNHGEEWKSRCSRLSIYATRIATHLGLDKNSIEDIRTAALLYDLGRMRLSRSVLRKASAQWLVQDEASGEKAASSGDAIDVRLLSETMGRILPLLLGLQEQKIVQAGKHEEQSGENVPLGARILVVADAYDTLTFGGGHEQQAVSPAEARDAIVARAGIEFDPEVVKAFSTAFNHMEMELPAFMF